MNKASFIKNGIAFFQAVYSRGERVTSDDLHMLLEGLGITPHEPRMWGTLIGALLRRKLITLDCYVKTDRACANRRVIGRYIVA